MWLSIMGMYDHDPEVFAGLEAPSYLNEAGEVIAVDREKIIQNILLQCAELELVYTSYDIMKLAIGVWSAAHIDGWNKLYATQKIEYNPIWNVDANITQHRDLDRDRGTTDENINRVSGFNSEDWSNAEKNNGSVTDQESMKESFTERRTGNIGVTASQDLIQKERDIADFSIIEYITQSFKERFCILVY